MVKLLKFVSALLAACLIAGALAACAGAGNVKIGVEFNLNYASAAAADVPAAKTVTAGKAYGELPRPPRTGFSFDGWFPDKETALKTARDAAAEITAKTVVKKRYAHALFARWLGAPVTLSYDLMGGKMGGEKSIPSRTVTTGLKYAMAVPDEEDLDYRYGYCFTGWYLNRECTGDKVEMSTVITAETNHTLYAGWRKPKTLLDFEEDSDRSYFFFDGKMEIVQHNGSKRLKLTNPTATQNSIFLYYEIGGPVPAGTKISADITFEGTLPEKYNAGCWLMTTRNGGYLENTTYGHRAFKDGMTETYNYNPGKPMTGVMFMLEFCRNSTAGLENSSDHFALWQANAFYIDNLKLIMPLPNPTPRNLYDFEAEYLDELEFAGNFEIENGTARIIDGAESETGTVAKRLEIKNTSQTDYTVYLYLRRQTSEQSVVTFNMGFNNGGYALNSTNKIGLYTYAAGAAKQQLGDLGAGSGQTQAFGAGAARDYALTVSQDCEMICLKLEFTEFSSGKTYEDWQKRIFYVNYIEVTGGAA